jgi:hypothetical protein
MGKKPWLTDAGQSHQLKNHQNMGFSGYMRGKIWRTELDLRAMSDKGMNRVADTHV